MVVYNDKMTIAGLTLGTGRHNLINYNAFLNQYKIFIGSLERSDRAESETSRTFEKHYFL